MSTVVIPITQSANIEHQFTTVSKAGRSMAISITVNKDVSESSAMADVRSSLSEACADSLEIQKTNSLTLLLVFSVLAWVFALVIGGFTAMLIDMAGWHAFQPYAFTFPESWPSFFANETVVTVLLRCHLLLLPVLLASLIVTWFYTGKNK